MIRSWSLILLPEREVSVRKRGQIYGRGSLADERFVYGNAPASARSPTPASFLRVELIKTRKVRVMSESPRTSPSLACIWTSSAPASSRYQSTLWPATVPQLCSSRPQATQASQGKQRIYMYVRSGIFADPSRIINGNLSAPITLSFSLLHR